MKKLLLIGFLLLSAVFFNLSGDLASSAFYFNSPNQAQNTDWPQFQHDEQHTGRTSAFVPPNYQVAWAWADQNHVVKNFVSAPGKSIVDNFEAGFKFTTLFSGQMQPIVANGRAYFGSIYGVMYAVNALTGDNLWNFQSQGAILSAAAYSAETLIFTSMDGNIYGLDAATGLKKWSYQTGAGLNAAPVLSQNTVYVGSRDGNFYALDTASGTLKWSYTTRVYPADNSSPFNKAPVVIPAALSEDGSTVFFGAENMFFYALDTATGQERWPPKKLIGHSFLYGWPVVKGNRVIIRTVSSLYGAEFLMEELLDGLSADPTWTEEKTAILNWLQQNPHQKTMYVFDTTTGDEPFQVAMGRVTGNNYPAHPPAIDNQGRVLTYWRTKRATFFLDGACFGTKYCPDLSALDLSTGDRIKITNPSNYRLNPELDNGYQFTVGGDFLYMANPFRGSVEINLNTGSPTYISAPVAKWDGGDFRALGVQVIYYGNDNQNPAIYPVPNRTNSNPMGFTGISIASTNNTPLLYINEADSGLIVAIRQG